MVQPEGLPALRWCSRLAAATHRPADRHSVFQQTLAVRRLNFRDEFVGDLNQRHIGILGQPPQ